MFLIFYFKKNFKNIIIHLTAIDFPERENRFALIYIFLNYLQKHVGFLNLANEFEEFLQYFYLSCLNWLERNFMICLDFF